MIPAGVSNQTRRISIDGVADDPRTPIVVNFRAVSPAYLQTLRIPIQGTFDRPQIDQRVFQDLAAKMATGTVTNTIEKELGKQLDKLRPDGLPGDGGTSLEKEFGRQLDKLFKRKP